MHVETTETFEYDAVDEINDDPVSPNHYSSHPSGVQCIEITRHMNFNIGNAMKYLWRHGLKGDAEQQLVDLRKAQWYIQDEIDRIEAESAAAELQG